MNLFSFTGNLGKDAEVKHTQSGTCLCEFSVAVKSGYGDKEKTNWVRCVMFGKKAEGQLPNYLNKGAQVAISGELELQEWEGASGKGAALAVTVQNIDLIGGKPQGQNQGQQGYAPQPQQAPMQHAPQQPQQPQYAQQPYTGQPQSPNNGYAQAQNGVNQMPNTNGAPY
uniref:Single-strand DNA-binding protein n=1 Tax=uncultured marine virus TaxID=186617 RepID=A0A0F7L5K1_9VIRU|nr:single-strand DNA-binding protein [uncultured marine virus]